MQAAQCNPPGDAALGQATVSAIAIRANSRATKPPAIQDMLRTHCLSDCLLMLSPLGLIGPQGRVYAGLPGLPGSPYAKKFVGLILAREYPSVLLGFVRELVVPRSLAGGGRGMLTFALPLRSIEALLLNATTVNA